MKNESLAADFNPHPGEETGEKVRRHCVFMEFSPHPNPLPRVPGEEK